MPLHAAFPFAGSDASISPPASVAAATASILMELGGAALPLLAAGANGGTTDPAVAAAQLALVSLGGGKML